MNSKPKGILDPETPILIVDDNPQFATVLRRILEGIFKYSTITLVDSIEKGYSLLQSAPELYRIVFVDFRFPGSQTGVDLLKRLAAEGLLESKAAFLITSEPNLENFKQAVSAGVIGVIAKPLDREDLRRQLELADRRIRAGQDDGF